MRTEAGTVVTAEPVKVDMSGLEPLKALGAFQVQQQVEMLEAALNAISIDYEGANKYKVKDAVGKDMRRPGAATGSARARVPTPRVST